MSDKGFYKFAFILVWLGATIGNIILVFCIAAFVDGMPPTKALLKILYKASEAKQDALLVLGFIGVIILVSVGVVTVLYKQFAEEINSLHSKRLFLVGIITSSAFFLLTFTKICSDVGVCI